MRDTTKMKTTLKPAARTLLGSLILGMTMTAAAAEPVRVLMETSVGDITLELDADKAPKSTANFVQYVQDKHYDGLVFHRVIKGFMIQGGGYDASYAQRKTRAPIENEAKNGLKNERGTIAMARTSDPHSASSQFFINHGNNAFLDYPGQDGWGYAVFGKVVDGMDVVDKIAEAPTGAIRPFGRDVPVEQVVIEKVSVIEAAEPAKSE
ncbi:peptidyl-prolyl cis-trans isomerase A (cyclophilin A) [Sinimarinibacterium flocculans]|uniref:Peptidyl-prolyl cis-trans isomerase n=3 Tax=Sinimarinibacterium flocculans TaxID=985250 RepID=A0A318EED8_9GAMM|nr:peptidyl-prolyl cis-trans isomerase A (cyclophilin A) [Sinimarinibacterium flocculans]